MTGYSGVRQSSSPGMRWQRNDDPFAEFDGRSPPQPPAHSHLRPGWPFALNIQNLADEDVSRSVQAVDSRRLSCVRLALMIYLFVSISVLLSILRGNRRGPDLISSLAFLVVLALVSMRIRQGLVHHRRLVEQVLRDGGAARSVQLQARGRQHAFSSLSPNQVRLMALNSDDYDALLSLDRTVDSTRGADQSGIDQLPEYRVAQSSRALDCAICLEPLGPGSAARILPCLHQFHKECIDLWLRDTCVCPVCKQDPLELLGRDQDDLEAGRVSP